MENPQLYPELSEWVEGQRLMLGVSILVADGGGTLEDERRAFEHFTGRLEALPPAGLELLAKVPEGVLRIWGDQQPVWREAFDRLVWNGQTSTLAAAKLIGERLKSAKLNPAQIIRLARLELGTDWSDVPDLSHRLEALMSDLGASRWSHQTAAALSKFRKTGDTPPRWALIEQSLVQGAYSWPLLVLNSQKAIACALPAAIEVRLDADRTAEVISGPNIVCDSWRPFLDNARRMAIEVWSKYHGAWDLDFQRAVRRASVKLDLRLASEIVEPFVERYGRFEFNGGSLESLLALEILARFLGLPGLGTTCATGRLGDWIPNGTGRSHHRKGGDCFVEPARRHLDTKIDYVKRSFFFDQIIAPPGSIVAGHLEHLRVSIANKLSDYAKCAFGQEMRHHRYVRAPDLAYSFKRFKGPAVGEEELDEIDAVYKAIKGSRSSILRFTDVTAESVAQALCKINDDTAEDDTVEFKRFDRNERQATFAFVRAVPNELNDRFWRVIWDLLGAEDKTFDEFRFTRSPARAAALFVEQMNWLKPTARRRVRAPDVLVILGSQHLSRPEPFPTGPFGRLQLQSIIEHIEAAEQRAEVLRRPTNPVAAHHLGRTRLILVEEDFNPPAFELSGPDELKTAFERLSSFRYGFTLEMASAMLELQLPDCTRLLGELTRSRAFGGPLLVYGEPAGEYFLRARAPRPTDPSSAADLHMRAANAAVGFLGRREGAVRFDFAGALKPASLHEAQWHVTEAGRIMRQSSTRSAGNYLAASDRLSRLGEPFGWTALRWAVRHSVEADLDLWNALKQHVQNRAKGDSPHPQELVLAARFAHKLQRRKRTAGEATESIAELASTKWRYLRMAWTACESLSPRERGAARFLVATTRATLCMEDEPDLNGFRRAQQETREALRNLRFARVIETPEWFEFVGDATRDPRKAADLYRKAFWNDALEGARGLRVEALAKYLGACESAEMEPNPELMVRTWVSLGPSSWKRIRDDTGLETGLFRVGEARKRWRQGKAILRRGSAAHATGSH